MDSTVYGILQARILEWVAFPFYKRSFQCRDRIQVSHVAGRLFTSWATREVSLGCWESHSKTVVLVLLLVAKLCPTLCGPVNCTTPGFPVLHYLWFLYKVDSVLRGDIWQCLDTLVIVMNEGRWNYYRYLLARGQGCCWTFYNSQDFSTTKNYQIQNEPGAET